MSAGLPRLAIALAVAPMAAAVATIVGYVLTDSDAFETVGLLIAAGGLGCLLAAAALMSIWLRRARREGVPEAEIWYRRRRVSIAMFVNLPVAFACIAIGTFWGSSELLTVTNIGTAPLQDVRIDFVGATKTFGDLQPGQSRSRRVFPGSGRLGAEWTVDGTRHFFTIDDPFNIEYFSKPMTIVMDGERAYQK